MDDTKSHNFMYPVHSDFFVSQKYYWWSGWTLRNLAKVLGQLYGGCTFGLQQHTGHAVVDSMSSVSAMTGSNRLDAVA
jgi:hypothetical protein